MQEDLTIALEVLKNGGTILYPTDTIWAIGCDSTNSKAINKLYKIKYRQPKKRLILLAESIEMVNKYVENIPEIAREMVHTYKQPLTIVYDKAINLPKNLIADDGSVAIRIPRQEFCLNLIKGLGKPLTSTSANISGEPSPFSFSKISNEIKDAVDFVCTSHQMNFDSPKPSTIIKVSDSGQIQIIRN